MRGGFDGLRGFAIRATNAWLVSFAVLFQLLLPAAGLPTSPDALQRTAICSTGHTGDAAADAPANSSDDPHSTLCRTICALNQVVQVGVAPDVSYQLAPLSTARRRIEPATDDRLILVRAPAPYSSRAPPTA